MYYNVQIVVRIEADSQKSDSVHFAIWCKCFGVGNCFKFFFFDSVFVCMCVFFILNECTNDRFEWWFEGLDEAKKKSKKYFSKYYLMHLSKLMQKCSPILPNCQKIDQLYIYFNWCMCVNLYIIRLIVSTGIPEDKLGVTCSKRC